MVSGRCSLSNAVRGVTEFPFVQVHTLRHALEECLTAKRSAGRRENYLKSLRGYLLRFASGRETQPVHAVASEQVEEYLSGLSGYNRATHLNRISTLFSFAVKRGYVSVNPCDRIERGRIDRRTPRVLTPEQCTQLYKACPTLCRPYLVLCLYAGLRPEEAMRLDWRSVSLSEKHVLLDADSSKVRQRRRVPLADVAVKLLAEHPHKLGPVAPSHSTVRRWKRKARVIVGTWPADLLRHTHISYALALHQDAGKVAYWMGNSAAIIKQHYDGLASPSAAREFFQSGRA